MTGNIVWHQHKVTKQQRSAVKNQKPCILWFTGLSGSGKSTIAGMLEEKINSLGGHTYLLDGDNVRHGLCGDLGFTDGDRAENIRRISEISKLFVDAGIIVITAFISPFRTDRAIARKLVETGEFLEVYISTPIDECERRDPKGLYSKARKGEINNFTGIDSVYEAPEAAEIIIDTTVMSAEQAAEEILLQLKSREYLVNVGV